MPRTGCDELFPVKRPNAIAMLVESVLVWLEKVYSLY